MRGLPAAAWLAAAIPALGFHQSSRPLKHDLTLRRQLPATHTAAAASRTTTAMMATPRGGGGAGSKSLLDSIFGGASTSSKPGGARKKEGQGAALVRQYFALWNERRMAEAVDLFTEDCSYEDTLYSGKFEGRAALRKYVFKPWMGVSVCNAIRRVRAGGCWIGGPINAVRFNNIFKKIIKYYQPINPSTPRHLFRVADALPDSFSFVLDDIADGGDAGTVGVQWHVESDGKPLPFTRGSSMYKVDRRIGKISYGFDVPEPTVKSGSVSLAILTVAGKLLDSPKRALPLAAWAFYCWFVFFSTVAPGPNALSLDPATWQEVRDLSLNFWLVMPLAAPDASPVLHPCLEGLFNFLLAYAALFSGFIVDGKREAIGDYQAAAAAEGEGKGKGPKNAFVPYVLGMQLLTNAVFLPYLVLRKPWFPSSSSGALTRAEAFGESRAAPLAFLGIGLLSLGWAALGREAAFGDLATRWASFLDIVGTDRLTFSFVIDLLYFWAFQGWLMDDDMLRRGATSSSGSSSSGGPNMAVARTVPFFGLVYYLLARPRLQLQEQEL